MILTPKVSDEAKKILLIKENLRVLEYELVENSPSFSVAFMQKTFLSQDENLSSLTKKDLKIVTKAQPTEIEIDNLLFANQVCKHVKSECNCYC